MVVKIYQFRDTHFFKWVFLGLKSTSLEMVFEGYTPVTQINVNSVIQQPISRSILDHGKHIIEGFAWTGTGVIIEVVVTTDGGESWHKANLVQEQSALYSWTFWKYVWKVPNKGEYLIMSRAKDSLDISNPLKQSGIEKVMDIMGYIL